MIALKTDALWAKISRFGTPWPPFDFNSGMGIADIGRSEAEKLGLLTPETRLAPSTGAFTDHLQASVQNIPEPFLAALKRFFGNQIVIEGDTVRWVGTPPGGIANSAGFSQAEPRDSTGKWTLGGSFAKRHFAAPGLQGGSASAPHPGHPLGATRELTDAEQLQSIDAALNAAASRTKAALSLGKVPPALAARVTANTLADPRDWSGKELRIDADFIRHAKRYHPNLTDDDFRAIPQLLGNATTVTPSTTDRKLPAVEFHLKKDSRTYLLIAASLNKQGQVQMTTLKKSAVQP